MRKAKNTLAIIGMIFAVIAAVLLVLHPVLDGIGHNMTAGSAEAIPFADHMKNIVDRIIKLFDFSWFSDFSNGISSHIAQVVILLVGIVVIVLLIVGFIMSIVKKHAKSIGLIIFMGIFFVLAAFVAAVYTNPDLLIESYSSSHQLAVIEMRFISYAGIGLAGVAGLLLLIAFILYITYFASMEKVVETENVVAETTEDAVAMETAVEEEAAPVVEEAAPAPAVENAPEADQAKVIRRILVHKSGKVVRVLNEHYYDVTTNVYVDEGYVDPRLPTETEQQHFEKIIQASQSALNAVNVAPAPAPAPAPVVVAPAPAPAPAPVVVAPVPAPAPAKPAAPKPERIPFTVRLKHSDKSLKSAYNEIKSEILSYGLKSRVSLAGDTFRLHTKTYIMIVVAGKSLKLYFALNPKDYKDSTFPLGDASKKTLHKDTPLVFKVKSDLSVRRAKMLIADCAAKDKLEQGEIVKHDHIKDLK